MELRQLHYFCVAARHEHISKAAEALFISQPALSRTIRNLEEELGVMLFEPSGRGIRLTHHGTYFYSVASHVLEELNAAQQKLSFQSHPTADSVYVTNQAPELFPYLLRGLFEAHPGFPVFEATANKGDALEGAENTHSGFILSYQPARIRGFLSECIAESTFVLLLPPSHRLADRETVSLPEIRQEAHIAYSALKIPESFEAELPYPGYLISDLPSVIRLVSQNYGIAILPDIFWRLLQRESAGMPEQMPVALPLKDCAEILQIFLTWPQKDSYCAYEQIFRNYCTEFFRALE